VFGHADSMAVQAKAVLVMASMERGGAPRAGFPRLRPSWDCETSLHLPCLPPSPRTRSLRQPAAWKGQR
jgi:hypothetical protein